MFPDLIAIDILRATEWNIITVQIESQKLLNFAKTFISQDGGQKWPLYSNNDSQLQPISQSLCNIETWNSIA